MKFRFSIIALAILTSCGHVETKEEVTQTPPNIVLILIDDMGWKDVGYAGSTYYDTPNIDRLATEGIQFTNAYSPAPVCTPSRGAIFSGKTPARTKLTTVFRGSAGPDDRLHDKSKGGGIGNQHFEARNRHALPKSEVIMAQALADGGYKTGFFGKWHIGECPGYYPDDRGFDVAKGYRLKAIPTRGHFGSNWSSGNFANSPDPDSTDFIPETLTDQCIDFMKENRDVPYFAVLSHYVVHAPITPRMEVVPKYESRKKSDQVNPKYAALVESVDESVARVLQTINELDQEDNTVVIFTSDNGGYTGPSYTSNYPLMGGKSFPFEGGMKVPLIVKWPKKITPSVTTERTVGTDLYPTILSTAGLDARPDQHIDGINLMPLMVKGEKLTKRPIIFHFPHYSHATGPFSSLVEDNWKLIKFYNDQEGAYLLYNLLEDPEEQINIADTDPNKRDSLAQRLELLLEEMQAEMPIKNPDYKYDPSNKKIKNLNTTMKLANKERQLFETRLGKVN